MPTTISLFSLRALRRLRGGFLFVSGLAVPALAPGAESTSVDDRFKAMDTSGDGRVSRAEHAAAAQQMFVMVDANQDGRVTADEMEAAHEKAPGNRAVKAADMSAAEKIAVVDADGDGVLTVDEHAKGSAALFEEMDTDHDGYVTLVEYAAGHAKMMLKRGRANRADDAPE